MSCHLKSPETKDKDKHETAVLFWKPSSDGALNDSELFIWDLTTKQETNLTSVVSLDGTVWTSLSPDKKALVCSVRNDIQTEKKSLFWVNQYYQGDHDWSNIDNTDIDSDFQSPYWMPDSSGFLYIKAIKQTQQGDFLHYEAYNLIDFRFSKSNSPKLVFSFQSMLSSIVWSPDQTTAAFFAQTGNEMKLWSYHLTTGILTPICAVEADQYSRNRIQWVDSVTLIWLELRTLYKWSLSQKTKETLVQMPDVIMGFDYSLLNSQICMTYTLSESSDKTVCILYSWKTVKSQILSSSYRIDSPRFSPDGSSILFFQQNHPSQKPELIVFTLMDQKKTTICEVGDITIYPWDTNPSYAKWSNDSKSILLEKREEGTSTVMLYRLFPAKLEKQFLQTEYTYTYSFSPSNDWINILYPDPQTEKTTILLFRRNQKENSVTFTGEWLGWLMGEW